MTMEDLLEVTDEMMDYLRGDREDLHVMTVMDGQEREFFNAREIAHMEDVQGLFLGSHLHPESMSGSVCLCPCLYGSYKG